MSGKRGRPASLLSKMKGATLTELRPVAEIRNTISYGTPAWRLIRIRQWLGEQRGLQPNFLSAVGLAEIKEQVEAHARGVRGAKALGRLWNKLRAEGKLPARRKWLKERDKLLKQHRPNDTLPKQWIEAAHLWRELSQQIESALVIGDEDWLNELAKAIRGEAKPEQGTEFACKVLDLYRPHATAGRIYDELERLDLVVTKGRRYKVLDRVFASVPDITDAIRDLCDRIKLELKKRPPKLETRDARAQGRFQSVVSADQNKKPPRR
jgi:hypothetical protein